VQQRRG